ncbi:hypothetical protein EMPS_11301 [Entomortierella parvispora]|uniref:Uncharacterized protein n=1 Tax=Entomortierella parvispora TaxID=205924 RepID=A0A9P3HLL3_9FUNG|nr:hypothetical protein EMPS_11301 [Entomortierella parvispora]
MGRERNSSPSLPPSPAPSRILRTLRTPRTPQASASASATTPFQQTTPSTERAMSIDDCTPSKLLSRDMNLLGLSSGTRRTTPGTPSIRMVDSRKHVAPNSSLPFERLGLLARSNSPRSSSNPSSAPYPPRVKSDRRHAVRPAPTTAATRPRVPLSSSSISSGSGGSNSSSRPALMARPTMVVDEDENPFMTTAPAPKTPTAADMMDPFQAQEDMAMLEDEDAINLALCSPGSEKENLTPKAIHDNAGLQRTEGHSSLAPQPVCRAGPITRSRRAALGAISPRLWNTYGPDPSLLLSKESLKKAALGAFSAKAKPDAGSSSVASGAGGSNDNTHISDEDAAAIRRVIECEIEPQRVAFNRQAQQVAGQIFHWHQGEYRLVDEKERQNWPSEWKFEVFKDPDTTAATQGPMATAATTATATTITSGKGKGKMVDSVGSVPKRVRTAREPLGSMKEL